MFLDTFMCHLIYSENNKNNNDEPNYNCVYLCVNEEDVFRCVKYNSFQEANQKCNRLYCNYNKNIITTMIPVCRFLPVYFHKYVLHYKLSKMFIKIKL